MEKNKRAYESKNDAYQVFAKMLKAGNPPDSWDDLLKSAKNKDIKRALLRSYKTKE